MTAKKISQLPDLGAAPAATDELVIVDSGVTKKVSVTNLNKHPDNVKASFGDSDDLQIYHDGTHSYVSDQGTGSLRILAENFQVRNPANNEAMIIAIPDSGVTLYHDNSLKLSTTATGIDVTGTATMDELSVQTAQGDITIPTNTSSLNFARAGTSYIRATDASGSFTFITGANDFATQRLKVAANGDISFYEDTGTTPKFFWDASAESLNVGGSVNYNYGINVGDAGYGINSTGVAQLVMRGTEYRLQGVSAAPMTFFTANSERARIDPLGNLLVGKTSADNTTVGNRIRGDGFTSSVVDNATVSVFNRLTSDGESLQFQKDNAIVGNISVTGSSTAYNTSSDYRLKENISSMDNASERVLALNPVRFNFIVDPDKTVDGFIAHEAQAVVPEAVTGSKDAMRTEDYEVSPAVYEDVIIPAVEEVLDEEGNVLTEAQPERTEQRLVSEAVMGTRELPDYQGIDQSKLVPLLTKALQEALERIAVLEAKVGV